MSFTAGARALIAIAALCSAIPSATAATTTTTTTLANRPPIANAGPDRAGIVNAGVTFDASASSDPDGTIIAYWWTWGDGTSTTSATSAASHVYTKSGTFSAVLWVQDNKNAWSLASDVAVATIGASSQTTTTTLALTTTTKTTTTTKPSATTTTLLANRAPVANAGPDQSTQTLITLTFNGSGSSDPDGSISFYSWNFGDGATASTAVATHAYATAGTYTVTLAVMDNRGATATDTARVTVADRPPTANAGPDKVAAPGASVAFDGSASTDPDGSITAYAWAFGDGATASGRTASHTYAVAGSYAATLTVTDNNGARGSDAAAVTVAAGSTTWASRIGGGDYDGAYVVASDAAGNVYVGGQFRGSMTVGTTTLASAGLGDGFLVKYTSGGTVAWAKRVGGAGDDSVEGVAVDPVSGDVVVAGRFAGTANFGGATFTAGGASDMVVAKYGAATGAHVWSKAFGSAYDDSADAVAVDPSGNIYLTGYFKGSINFGGTTLTVPYGTDLDVFLTKLTSAGAHVWSKHFTNTGNDRGYGVATDAQGNVALVGWFSNAINFGGSQLFASSGLADAFVAKFTSAGTHVWSRQMGSTTAEEQAYGVAMDASGNVAVCGYAIAAIDLGGGLLASLGNADGWVAEYAASSGAHRWSRRVGGLDNDYANAVAVDASGNVVVAGSFRVTASFGGLSLVARGASDGFVAKFTSAGSALWARGLGGLSTDVATGVAISAGAPVTAGYFYGSGTFGTQTLTSGGLQDAFVARLSP